MNYDFDMIQSLLGMLSSKCHRSDDTLEISIEPGITLCFVNHPNAEESLMAFKDTPWHVHGAIGFADNRGYHTEMEYPDVIRGILDGTILICERFLNGTLVDRWLMHSAYADEFRWMEPSEEIRVKRANVSA